MSEYYNLVSEMIIDDTLLYEEVVTVFVFYIWATHSKKIDSAAVHTLKYSLILTNLRFV